MRHQRLDYRSYQASRTAAHDVTCLPLPNRRNCSGRTRFRRPYLESSTFLRDNMIAAAANREQPCVFGTLCTDSQHGQFFLVLDWHASRCSRKFCVAIADVRKRTFHRGPCGPPTECIRECDSFGFLDKRARAPRPRSLFSGNALPVKRER